MIAGPKVRENNIQSGDVEFFFAAQPLRLDQTLIATRPTSYSLSAAALLKGPNPQAHRPKT